MMKINSNKFSLLFSSSIAVFYFVCSVFVALWPDFSLKISRSLFHLTGNGGGALQITLGGFVVGLVQTFVYSYIVGYIVAWALNRSAE